MGHEGDALNVSRIQREQQKETQHAGKKPEADGPTKTDQDVEWLVQPLAANPQQAGVFSAQALTARKVRAKAVRARAVR